MTAVAKLLPCPFCGKSVATLSNTDELSGRPDISFMHTVVCNAHAGGCGSTVGYEPDQDDAISTWNRRAALSPAELGGVGGLPPLPTPALRPHWADTTDYYSAAQMLNFARAAVLSTPRAAEAVSVADIGLCNWAAHILSDSERFNTRANDASAAIRRLVSALTPPSAKGEKES